MLLSQLFQNGKGAKCLPRLGVLLSVLGSPPHSGLVNVTVHSGRKFGPLSRSPCPHLDIFPGDSRGSNLVQVKGVLVPEPVTPARGESAEAFSELTCAVQMALNIIVIKRKTGG